MEIYKYELTKKGLVKVHDRKAEKDWWCWNKCRYAHECLMSGDAKWEETNTETGEIIMVPIEIKCLWEEEH